MRCDECGKHWIVRSCSCCGTDDQCDDDQRDDDDDRSERDDELELNKEDVRWM